MRPCLLLGLVLFVIFTVVWSTSADRRWKELKELVGEANYAIDPMKYFQIDRLLGSGRYAKVYKASFKLPLGDQSRHISALAAALVQAQQGRSHMMASNATKLPVYAVKIMKLESASAMAYAINEIQNGRKLMRYKIPNVIEYQDYFLRQTKSYGSSSSSSSSSNERSRIQGELIMVTKFIDGVTLDHLAHKDLANQSLLLKISYCMLDTVRQLQKARICHADITASNVMLDARGNVFLVDFGLAQTIIPEFGAHSLDSDFKFTVSCSDVKSTLVLLKNLVRQAADHLADNGRSFGQDIKTLLRLFDAVRDKKLSLDAVLRDRVFDRVKDKSLRLTVPLSVSQGLGDRVPVRIEYGGGQLRPNHPKNPSDGLLPPLNSSSSTNYSTAATSDGSTTSEASTSVSSSSYGTDDTTLSSTASFNTSAIRIYSMRPNVSEPTTSVSSLSPME